MAKEKVKAKRSSADKAVNAVIAVALVVMIALASYALYDKFRPRDRVKDVADDMGISVEEFMTEYGIGEDVTPNTKMMDAYNNMTLENALKLEGGTFEDFMASGEAPETVTPDMKVADYQKLMEEIAAAAAESEEASAEGEEVPAE